MVKNPPEVLETPVRFLGWEDPLEKGGISYPLQYSWVSPVAQLVKNLPTRQETWVRSLCWEDPLEKGKATHSSFWPGEFHGLYIVHGVEKSWTQLSNFHLKTTI